MDVDVERVEEFLTGRLGRPVSGVERIGAGAWSRCFGFDAAGARLAARFGDHVVDFEKDRRAAAFAGPDLPVPEVLAIGEAFGGHFAISTWVPGSNLEDCTADEWEGGLADRVAAALEAMRTAEIPPGWGSWDGAGRARCRSWREVLLTVGDDGPEHRTHGWRAALRASPGGDAAFLHWLRLLEDVATDDVPRSLLHRDLINRNVHFSDGRITGVFDWACGSYGDHLYDLAWFEFWAPWHPNLDVRLLRDCLEARWRRAGHAWADVDRRLLACHLHIALDHLAYNAHLGDWRTLGQVDARVAALAG